MFPFFAWYNGQHLGIKDTFRRHVPGNVPDIVQLLASVSMAIATDTAPEDSPGHNLLTMPDQRCETKYYTCLLFQE